jgi:hypothetical protein
MRACTNSGGTTLAPVTQIIFTPNSRRPAGQVVTVTCAADVPFVMSIIVGLESKDNKTGIP